MAHGANGFQKRDKVLTNEEKMALWKKLQMKYTAEIEHIRKLADMDIALCGEVSTETKALAEALNEKIVKENS